MRQKILPLLILSLSILLSASAMAAGPIASRDMIDLLKYRPVSWSSGNWYAWPSITHYPSPDNPADYSGTLVLPPCGGTIRNDCITSLEFRQGEGAWIKGAFKRYVPFSQKYISSSGSHANKSAELNNNFPDSAMSGLWEFPGLSHPGGREFMFSASFGGEFSGMKNPNGTNAKLQYDGVGPFMRLDAISIVQEVDDYQAPDINRKYGDFCTMGEIPRTCIRKFDFPEGTEFRANLNLKVAKQFWNSYNWIIGYGSHPSITISINSDGSNNYVFSAAPVYRTFPISLIPKTEQGFADWIEAHRSYLKEASPNQEFYEETTPQAFISWRESRVNEGIDGEQSGALSALKHLEKYFAPELAIDVAEWGFRKAQPTGEDFSWVNQCSTSGEISGLSSTNASIAKPAPPRWNAANQSLEFTIAAPHTFANGTPIVGEFNLALSKKVADCLWGLNVANARATISVTYADGSPEVTNSTMKVSNNLVEFSLTGFHYSVDRFRIKLEAEPNPTPTVNGKPKTILKTIFCTKGKTIKKITKVNPQCPSGYKLKK